MTLKNYIIVILCIIVIVILLQNTQVITLRLVFWDISMSRIIFMPMLIIIGFIMGYLTAQIRRKKKQRRIDSAPQAE